MTLTKAPEARPGSLEPLSDASITWRYIAPPGVTLEMCQRPDYWRNVAREAGQARTGGRVSWNKIEIIAEDGTWEAELRVLSAADGLVTTRLLREWHRASRPGRKASLPEGYTVEHIENNGWRALDRNGEIVSQRLPIEDMAIQAASDHAKRAAGKSDQS